ncbi:hypothetical protein HX857_27845, partial [Pseudomonas gingeri]|uniref:hypothetical protein n=1 Tax=Pseudomonas gingeri TaxID=117681 RepID=UPI0015B8F6E2
MNTAFLQEPVFRQEKAGGPRAPDNKKTKGVTTMRQHNKISRALQPTLFGLSLLSVSLPGLSLLGLAVAQPVRAEGFIDDAKARLDLR